jgi:hypothetical protein
MRSSALTGVFSRVSSRGLTFRFGKGEDALRTQRPPPDGKPPCATPFLGPPHPHLGHARPPPSSGSQPSVRGTEARGGACEPMPGSGTGRD